MPQKPLGWVALAALIAALLTGFGIPLLGLAFWVGMQAAEIRGAQETGKDAIEATKSNAVTIQQLMVVTERLNKGVEINEQEIRTLRQQQYQRERAPGHYP